MTTDNAIPKKIHQGRNIKRFREILGIKQEALAFDMGVSQSSISDYESKEILDDKVLDKIAEILKVPAEAIKNFDEEQAVNIISNTFSLDNGSIFNAHNTNPVFNPVEAVLKMHEEKIALYERMLKEKDEMMERLEKLIGK